MLSAASGSITFDGVTFGYRRHRVLDRFDWTVGPGITALMGPNGAGKTTLLSLAAGLVKPQAGRVETTDGGRVFLLPQRFEFAPFMRIEEAVALTGWCAGLSTGQAADGVPDALDKVGLADRAGHRVRALSGGQRQRLGIACALGARPSVLLLDEPSVGLDPIQRASLRALLIELAAEVTIVLSTHLVDDIAGVADRVAVLDEGRLLFDGALAELTGPEPSIAGLERAYVDLVQAGAGR